MTQALTAHGVKCNFVVQSRRILHFSRCGGGRSVIRPLIKCADDCRRPFFTAHMTLTPQQSTPQPRQINMLPLCLFLVNISLDI